MNAEIATLERNHTWSLVPLPPGHKAIGYHWVYKIKYNSEGSVERYKVYPAVKGYTQVEDIDYKETFSNRTKFTTLRCLLTIATSQKLFTHQLSVQNVFLHSNL